MKQLINQINFPELTSDNTLHVVGVISNVVRYHSRYRLYREWLSEMQATPNVKVYTVEAAFKDRQHEVTSSSSPFHLQLQTHSACWIKESMINLAVRTLLPKNWKYLCWSDCDVFFRDPSWAKETLQQLQTFNIVQPWSDCVDLGPNGEILQHFRSFGIQHQRRIQKQTNPRQPYQYAHTGYAVACTRSFWENTGGLPDFCILGSGDHHLLFACIGEVTDTIHKKMTSTFHNRLFDWEQKAIRITNREVGYTPGRIEHAFHGAKKRRFYRERWQILIAHKYCPDLNTRYTDQGLIQLTGNSALEHEIHNYNLSRREDSIDQD